MKEPQAPATTAEVHAWLVDVAQFCVRKVQATPDPDLIISEGGFRIVLQQKLIGAFQHWWAPANKSRWN